MKLKMNKEIYLSTAIIVVCAWLYSLSQSLPLVTRRYPQGLLMIIGILAVIEMVTKTIKISLSDEIPSVKKPITPLVRVIIAAVICLSYVFMLNYLGYFSSTIIFGLVFMLYLGIREPKTLIGVIVGMNLFIYILFVVLLRVRMPQGLLF
jgi:hypothetical protein